MTAETTTDGIKLAILPIASMEPRSFDRGDIGKTVASRFLPQASMEPRSFDRGDAETAGRPMSRRVALQWSRGLLTAETSRLKSQTCARAVALQWSRGLLTAETDAHVLTVDLQDALQWSRGLLTAETCVIRSVSSSCRGFNGAAVF